MWRSSKTPMGKGVSPQNRRVIEWYKSGVSAAEIAKKTGRPKSTISGVLFRARRRGELPARSANSASFNALKDKHRVAVGPLGVRLSDGLSREVAEWLVCKVSNDGYADIAEFICDLLVEAFYEEMETKDE